jgi:fibronectin-binding autotransporter adhesin
MSAVEVNGVFYKGDESGGTTTASGVGDSWSAKNWTDDDTLAESDNYLKITNQTAVVLAGHKSSPGRSAIAGVQVVNAYTGTLSYWDTNGTSSGSGNAGGTWGTNNYWSSTADGTGATGSWTSGNAAVFSAGTDGTGTFTVTLSGAQSADAIWVQEGNVTLSGSGLTLGSTGILRGDGSLTVNSAVTATDLTTVGTVTLGSSSNSISGLVTIGGTTTLAADQTWKKLAGTGTLDISSGKTLTLGDTATDGNFAGTLQGSGTLDKVGSGTHTIGTIGTGFTGTVTITAGTLAFESGTLSAAITGSGTLAKTTASNMVISSTGNTFTGKTTISGGILSIASQTSLGATPGSAVADQITLGGGGKIQGGTSSAGANLTLDANRGITITGGDSGFHTWTGFTTTVNGDITGAGSLGNDDGGTTVINGDVTLSGSIRVFGGTTTLNGDVDVDGEIRIENGSTVNINSSSLSADGGIFARNGTTNINLGSGSGGTGTLDDIELGNAPSQAHTLNHQAGDITVAHDIRIGHWKDETSKYNISGGTLTQPDTVTSPGNETQANLMLGIDGTGELHITGGTVNTTSLRLDARGDTTGTDTLTLTGGTLNIGKWGIHSGNTGGTYLIQLGGGTLGTTSSDATTNWSASWSSALNMELTGTNGNVTINPSADKSITLSGVLSGTGGFIKSGAGTLALSNSGNTYTGTSVVNAGTLNVSGKASKVTVNSGATLPGGTPDAAGTGTMDTLTLADGSHTKFRLAGGTDDKIVVTGADGFTVATGATHTADIVSDNQLFVSDEFTLFDYDGTIQGDGVSGITASLPNPHYSANVTDDTTNTLVKLTVASIDPVIWTGNGGSTWDVENTTSWKTESGGSASDFYTYDKVKFDNTSPAGTITLSGTIKPASVEFDSTNNHTLTGAAITGSGGLTKAGTGTLVLANDNTYTGTTSVTGGILQIGNGGTTGSVDSNIDISSGAVVKFNRSDAFTVTAIGGQTISGAGAVEFNGTGTMTLAGQHSFTGGLTVNSGTVIL